MEWIDKVISLFNLILTQGNFAWVNSQPTHEGNLSAHNSVGNVGNGCEEPCHKLE